MRNDNRAARTVILGVAASDSHVVANHLIAHSLRVHGFEVVNLGACTTVAEFAAAHAEHPHAEAVVVGSLNGHAHEDLQDLPAARARGELRLPLILGGNLSVGSHKDGSEVGRLRLLGVDVILSDPQALPATLDALRERAGAAAAGADLAAAAAHGPDPVAAPALVPSAAS